jgi:hypothetical protein
MGEGGTNNTSVNPLKARHDSCTRAILHLTHPLVHHPPAHSPVPPPPAFPFRLLPQNTIAIHFHSRMLAELGLLSGGGLTSGSAGASSAAAAGALKKTRAPARKRAPKPLSELLPQRRSSRVCGKPITTVYTEVAEEEEDQEE